MAGTSIATRVYLSFIGLALTLAGAVFCWLMWRSFQRARAEDHWPVVPCVILESGIQDRQIDPNSPPERRFAVKYAYVRDDQSYTSELVRLRGSGWSSKTDVAEAYIEKYPEGSNQECHVNPENPEQAVLEKESKAPGYSLWFPAIFVVGGIGMVAGAWRRKSGEAVVV
ncbi:DUF3592 domain-containing protein [Luteolibacter sp. Populi]|uniref:DUF3592 domain-containing protein n=1 Tax=Luteolibacter sp. Populi TaxID=3230487 RepID=UPI003467EA8E